MRRARGRNPHEGVFSPDFRWKTPRISLAAIPQKGTRATFDERRPPFEGPRTNQKGSRPRPWKRPARSSSAKIHVSLNGPANQKRGRDLQIEAPFSGNFLQAILCKLYPSKNTTLCTKSFIITKFMLVKFTLVNPKQFGLYLEIHAREFQNPACKSVWSISLKWAARNLNSTM